MLVLTPPEHDLSLQAVQEPGWLRDPIAPRLIGEFRQARSFMNKLGGGLSEEGDDMEYRMYQILSLK